MILSSPWGLLALLAIPAILALHFFRDRRRVRRIGGLHLWRFARTRLPVGRRFDRLMRNLPLLFQLLAALLLALLVAGFDIPRRELRRHNVLILDDSASMQAGGPAGSPAARARRLVEAWARPDDRFTLVAAGLHPRVIAGPFAPRADLFRALADWTPAAPGCDAESALSLAAKFLTGGEKILFATDGEAPVHPLAERLEIAALGLPRDNAAILFADRLRAAPGRDRVVLTLCSYAAAPHSVRLQAAVAGRPFYDRTLSLAPAQPLSLNLETAELARPIELSLAADALAADNRAALAPVALKVVRAAVLAAGEATAPAAKALRAVPNTTLTDSVTQADLVLTAARDYVPAPANRRLLQFPYLAGAPSAPASAPRLAEGRAVTIDRRQSAVAGLALDGVLWPFIPSLPAPGAQVLLALQSQPLLTFEPLDARRARYRFNLLWDRTNLFRQAAWPMLIQGLVEECRDAIPGLSRANWRVGEPIPLNLEPDPRLPARFELRRDGALATRFTALPESLAGLAAGAYELLQDGRAPLARFQVNFFAPGESDLRALQPRAADLARLSAGSIRETQTNKALFLGLVMLILLLTALSWIFQDMSH